MTCLDLKGYDFVHPLGEKEDAMEKEVPLNNGKKQLNKILLAKKVVQDKKSGVAAQVASYTDYPEGPGGWTDSPP